MLCAACSAADGLCASSAVAIRVWVCDSVEVMTGSGLSDLDTGIRVRYEISRKFAPYVGFAYAGKYGDTATYARQAGEAVDSPTFVFGIRVWH